MKNYLSTIVILILSSCQLDDATKLNEVNIFPNEFSDIRNILDSINITDQMYRNEIDSIKQEFGLASAQMESHWAKIIRTDSSNLLIVEEILDKCGWLSETEIGYNANSTLFFVIQHSNHETQEKYLPMMREAVYKGHAYHKNLALLEDRVALGNGNLQIYGSQIGTDQNTGKSFVLPLYDPENVNERRGYMTLGPIEDYISYWNIEWNVVEHLEKLPERINKLKEQNK